MSTFSSVSHGVAAAAAAAKPAPKPAAKPAPKGTVKASAAPGGAPPPAPPAPGIDMNAAIAQYGIVGQIVNAVPELRKILQDAITGGLSPDAFNAQIAASPWYHQNADTVRNYIFQQASDPATFSKNLQNQISHVTTMANSMGLTVDANQWANASLMFGWSDEQLKSVIGSQGGLQHGAAGALVGDAAQTRMHLQQLAQDYGIPATDQWMDDATRQIAAGRDTIDGFTMVFRNQAKAAYPQFVSQIDQGMTLSQIADPYMATYAKTLEVPQSSVSLQDPAIRRALSITDTKTGTQVSQPLWQFEQTLKKDPRYDYTDQAKTDAYSTLSQVGKDWGFH